MCNLCTFTVYCLYTCVCCVCLNDVINSYTMWHALLVRSEHKVDVVDKTGQGARQEFGSADKLY